MRTTTSSGWEPTVLLNRYPRPSLMINKPSIGKPSTTGSTYGLMMTSTKEYTNDAPEAIAKGAIKYDAGKAPVFRGLLAYFPRAARGVANVSLFGATKYAWKGWEEVDDGFNRYSDGLVRHLSYEGEGEVLDPDSGLLHAEHTAWNCLARLELLYDDIDAAGGIEEYIKSRQ